MNKIGSLYQVKKWYWLLFPNKETAVHVAVHVAAPSTAAETGAAVSTIDVAYWSKRYNCNVTYISPEEIVVLLETDGILKKVLSTKGEMGWTWFEDEFNDYFEEVST